MEVYVRKRKSGPPFEVIAALVVGIAIGFAVSYAIFGRESGPTPPDNRIALPAGEPAETITPPPEEPPTPSTETAQPAPSPPEPPVPQPAPSGELAKLEDVWPARHLFIAVKGEKLDSNTKDLLAELKPGGVVLRSGNIKVRNQLLDLIAEIKTAVGLGTTIDSLPLIAVGQEGGALNLLNLKDAPTAAKIGTAKDLDAARAAGASVAQSCVDRGIAVLLGPVLDVYGKGAPKETQARCFGDNHLEVAAIGLAYADGARSAGVLPVVKHFPGMGTIKGDSQKTLATLTDDQDRLSQIVFPFNEAARCNVSGILVGHVIVPSLDSETKPLPAASLSAKFLKGLLRDKWGYPGVILADDVNAGAIAKTMPVEKAAVAALASGNDAVLMLNSDLEKIRLVCATIETAASDGTLDRALLSDSKKRLDVWQQALKMPPRGLDGPFPQLPSSETAAAQQGAPTTDTASVSGEFEYTVASGDSLSKLANTFKVSADGIREWNKLTSDKLTVGQKLIIKLAAPLAPSDQPPAPPAPPAPAPSGPAPTEASTFEPPSEEPAVQPPANSKAVEYIVKGGDFLSSIATKHKVTHQDIMTWNHLNDTQLGVGQKLTIYVPADFVVPAETVAAPGKGKTDAPQSEPVADAPGTDTPPATTDTAPAGDTEITYTVKRGDNLSNIASKYGVTADDIRGWNGIAGNRIDIGQQLKIRPKKIPAE